MLKTRLFNSIKRLIPKISSTEMIALRSGNTSIDRHILQGTFKFPEPVNIDRKLPEKTINSLLHDFTYQQKTNLTDIKINRILFKNTYFQVDSFQVKIV